MKRIIFIQTLFCIFWWSLAHATHDIHLTYDRLGREKTVSDALGSREFRYNKLQLESETISGLYNVAITQKYATTGVKGRHVGFRVGSNYDVTYGYDQYGRFNAVSWEIASRSGRVDYSYLANSNLIEQISGQGYHIIYSYEPHRDYRAKISNQIAAGTLSQYDYIFDGLGRKISVTNSGAAFNQPSFNTFGYSGRNELIESARFAGTDINNFSNPFSQEYQSVQYDNIGNRTQSTTSNESATYITNNLNQYLTRTTQTKVTDFEYDADGNMTAMITDGSKKALKYNGENRLISVKPEIPTNGDFHVEFSYDYMGRRIRKAVSVFNKGAALLRRRPHCPRTAITHRIASHENQRRAAGHTWP